MGRFLRRHRKILVWVAASVGCLLVAAGVAGYALVSRLNGNIKQANVRPLLGHQPPDLHPQAENIAVIGSDGRQGQAGLNAPGLVPDQPPTPLITPTPPTPP